MNKTLTIIASLAFAAAFTACDEIKEDERYIELPSVEAKRVVLLEEFTGQDCINCPDAHEVIENLLEQYDDKLIAVSIHGGPLSISINDRPYGLANDQSNAYWEMYGRPDLPAGAVNRATTAITSDQWATKIRDILAQPSTLDLSVSAKLSDDGKNIEIVTAADPHANISGNLLIWVVESNLVRRQKLPGNKTNKEYVHNNVFRAAVNSIEGEAIALTTREPQTFSHTIAMVEDWEDVANLSIVAFVYDKNGVIQAAKAKVAVAEE